MAVLFDEILILGSSTDGLRLSINNKTANRPRPDQKTGIWRADSFPLADAKRSRAHHGRLHDVGCSRTRIRSGKGWYDRRELRHCLHSNGRGWSSTSHFGDCCDSPRSQEHSSVVTKGAFGHPLSGTSIGYPTSTSCAGPAGEWRQACRHGSAPHLRGSGTNRHSFPSRSGLPSARHGSDRDSRDSGRRDATGSGWSSHDFVGPRSHQSDSPHVAKHGLQRSGSRLKLRSQPAPASKPRQTPVAITPVTASIAAV